MKRLFDLSMATVALVVFFFPMVIAAIAVRTTSRGPSIYWSNRVGRGNRIFRMPKFRSMKIDTPAIATHLLDDTSSYLTPIGSFLRKTSIDELPQLWSIWIGHMSFVGPRPALFNQNDLIALRTERGVDPLRPGLTGWAQINGRDDISIADKVELDAQYNERKSLLFDLEIIWKSFSKVASGKNVSH